MSKPSLKLKVIRKKKSTISGSFIRHKYVRKQFLKPKKAVQTHRDEEQGILFEKMDKEDIMIMELLSIVDFSDKSCKQFPLTFHSW